MIEQVMMSEFPKKILRAFGMTKQILEQTLRIVQSKRGMITKILEHIRGK